jgi:tetratricopeptide (TPR) repeat protein
LERAVLRDRGRFGTRQLLAHTSAVGGLATQLSAACLAAVQDFAWAANDKSMFSGSWKFGVTWMCTLLPGAVSDFNAPLRFIDSMIEQWPDGFDPLAKKGALLFRAGRFEEASCEIDRAFALHPERDDWDDSLMLAMAHSRAGHASAALRAYERAMGDWERNLVKSPAALQWGDLGLFHALESEAEAALAMGSQDHAQTGSGSLMPLQPIRKH